VLIQAGSGQDDYKIVVAGTAPAPTGLLPNVLPDPPPPNIRGADFLVARLGPDGRPDNTFGVDGKLLTEVNGNDEARDVIIHNNKIVVGGGGGGAFALARYSVDDGSLDTTFDGDGKVVTDLGGNSDVAGLTTQSGKLVAAGKGNSGGDFALARYDDNGSLDTAFGTGGKQTTSFSSGPAADAAHAVTTQTADQKVVAAGVDATGTGDFALARYLAS